MTNDQPRVGDARADETRPADAGTPRNDHPVRPARGLRADAGASSGAAPLRDDTARLPGGVTPEGGTEIPYRPGHPDPHDDERPVTGLPPDVGDRDPWHENRPRPVTARDHRREDADAIPTRRQRLEGRIDPVDGGPREDLDERPGRAIPGDHRPPERR